MRLYAVILAVLLVNTSIAQQVLVDTEFNKGLNQARSTGKILVVDCYTTWCAPCKKMDAEVFEDAEIINYLRTRTVFMKSDMESAEGIKIAMRFAVKSYPTFLIISPKGKIIQMFSGYRDKVDFMRTIDQAISSENRYLKGYTLTSKDFSETYEAAYKKGGSFDPDKVASLLKVSDLTNEEYWLTAKTFAEVLPENVLHAMLDSVGHLNSLYGRSDVAHVILAKLHMQIEASINEGQKVQFDSLLIKLAEVRKKLGMEADEQTELLTKVRFHGINKKWDQYNFNATLYRRRFGKGEDQNFCRQIASDCDYLPLLSQASLWTDELLRADSGFYNLFSKYRIELKLANLSKAQDYLERSVQHVSRTGNPSEREYLLNNLYRILLKSPEDENKLTYVHSIIDRVYGDRAAFTVALLYTQFYFSNALYEKLFMHFKNNWALLLTDKGISKTLVRILNKLSTVASDTISAEQIGKWREEVPVK